MTLESIVINYGYPAIFIGTFIEGETILVLGGLVVHLGYLSFPGVVGAAFAGSLLGDQLAFHVGRLYGTSLLDRRPGLRKRIDRVHKKTSRFRSGIVVGFRFLYGLRNIIPFMLGTSAMPSGKFILLNAVGAVLWSTSVTAGGYLFGKAMDSILGNVRRYELEVMAAVAVIGLAIWLFHFWRSRLVVPSS